jgi:hypothetical protein
MSLPSGVINRPTVSTPHPAVVGGVWRVGLAAFVLLLPILLHAAMQAPGVRWRYECTALERAIESERLERRRLLAERSRLLAPERLHREARRLGLVTGAPHDDTFVLARTSAASAP